MMAEEQTLAALVTEVADELLGRQWLCVTAESCTGGGIAKALTDQAGSSQWFDRGFVTYSNAAKQEMLGVPAEIIEHWGAVSEQTARAMAEGALRHSGAHTALAVTGIAGPSGGTPDKPVGTVAFAWALRGAETRAQTIHIPGNRGAVREASIARALEGLLDRLRRP